MLFFLCILVLCIELPDLLIEPPLPVVPPLIEPFPAPPAGGVLPPVAGPFCAKATEAAPITKAVATASVFKDVIFSSNMFVVLQKQQRAVRFCVPGEVVPRVDVISTGLRSQDRARPLGDVKHMQWSDIDVSANEANLNRLDQRRKTGA